MADETIDRFQASLACLERARASEKLLQLSLDFLIDTANVNYQESLSDMAGDFGLSGGELKALAQSLLVLYGEALNNGSTASDFLRKRSNALGLSSQASQLLIQQWDLNQKKIAQYLVSKIIAKNRLVDLDWSFGVTASTDELDHVGKTFLQLKLTIDSEQEGRKTHFLEMSVDQFYQFLASLEKCRSFLDFVAPR